MKLLSDFLDWLNPKVIRDTSRDIPWFTPPKVNPPTWSIYKDRRNEWRWRITAANGEIIGASAEGYKSKTACFNNLKMLTKIKL